MKRNQIEARVYVILERLEKGQPIEDDLVELKGTWIDPVKAARRIAGHANSSNGEPILWLMGVDEKTRQVVPIEHDEFSNWYAKVKGQFDAGVYPDLAVHVNVPVDSLTVVALYFLTDRTPYVVKSPGGGHITFEIPWRKGVMTHSASRSQIMRMLGPISKLPEIDIVSGWGACKRDPDNCGFDWMAGLNLYVLPHLVPLGLPFHRIHATIHIEKLGIEIPLPHVSVDSSPSPTISTSYRDVILNGPGSFFLQVSGRSDRFLRGDYPIKLNVQIKPMGSDRHLNLQATLRWSDVVGEEFGPWHLDPQNSATGEQGE